MSDVLVDEGWRWPAAPGPGRRVVAAAAVAVAALVLVWGVWATGWLDARRHGADRVEVEVAEDGAITIDGVEVDTSQRRGGSTTFVVGRRSVDASRTVRARVRADAGIDADRVVVRIVQPWGGQDRADVLVVVAGSALPAGPRAVRDAPPLADMTDPVDEQVAAQYRDHRLMLRLRRGWWWLAPLVLVLAAGVPLLLWRRAARRFHSMRRPGPGAELDAAPPSSLDPVGAAILVAGARPVDHAAAFAGHVLDLVERKQLPMRRSTVTPPGMGTLVGLQHADELDDPVAPLLLGVVGEEEYSFLLPDVPARVRRLDAAGCASWAAHVEARAGFERVLEVAPVRRARAAAIGCAVVLLVAVLGQQFADWEGRRTALLLVAMAAGVCGAVLAAWVRDAVRWRVVARGRRLERAQWLAWRAAAARRDGPGSDQRNLPVLAAIDAPREALRSAAPPLAVDLGAVTGRTVDALRLMCSAE